MTSGRTKSCGCLKTANGNNIAEKIFDRSKRKSKVHNTYDLSGEYGIGYTSKGKEFYFDLEDYEKIKDFYWSFSKDGYLYAVKNKEKYILHRFILGVTDPTIEVDHIYHKKYDNRKSQLRLANRSKNSMNKGLRSDNTSGITGVCWNRRNSKWKAYICVNGKQINLGHYTILENAVQVRKDAEKKYFGEYRYKE